MDDGVALLDKWSNGKVDKKEDGSFKTLKWLAQIKGQDENGKVIFDEPDYFPWTLVCIELDYMVEVRKYATKAGVKFVDRTGIVDLLKDGDKISGAVGYNIDNGEQVHSSGTVNLVPSITGPVFRTLSPVWVWNLRYSMIRV